MPWKIQNLVKCLIALFLLASQSEAAEIWGRSFYTPDDEKLPKVRIGEVLLIGNIETGDTKKLAATIDDGNRKGITTIGVSLYSRGGSLSEGLALGRYIRSRKLAAVAPDGQPGRADCSEDADGHGITASFSPLLLANDCVCASACGLAWLGGIARYGTVGLHHMTVSDEFDRSSFDQLENSLALGRKGIDEFLSFVRAPDWVLAKILETPSSEMAYYDAANSGLELDSFYKEHLLRLCGEEPPLEAEQFLRSLERKADSGELDRGGEYALATLDEKLEDYDICQFKALYDAAGSSQSLSEEYDSARWGKDRVEVNPFDYFVPLPDGSETGAAHYDWWKADPRITLQE